MPQPPNANPDALIDPPKWGFGEMLRMVIPSSLMLMNAVILRFMDGLMVSRLGSEYLSSQTTAASASLVIDAIVWGTLGIISAFVSQSLGQGRKRRCARYAWASTRLSLIISAVALAMIPLSKSIMSLYGHSPWHQVLESEYFVYMLLTTVVACPVMAIEPFFFGAHRPKVVYYVSLAACAVNLLANYVLIFGKFGFPAMGIAGAGLGTLISWVVRGIILWATFLSPRFHKEFRTRMWRISDTGIYRRIIKYGWPVGVHMANAILCWGILAGRIIGSISPLWLDANTVAMKFSPLVHMPLSGIGIATCAVVGRYIGMGRPDIAKRRATTAAIIAIAYMLIVSGGLITFRHSAARLMVNVSRSAAPTELVTSDDSASAIADENYVEKVPPEQVIEKAALLIIFLLIFIGSDAIGIVYQSALRGVGDVIFPMVVSLVCTWSIEVLCGSMMVRWFPHLGGVGPYIPASIYMLLASLLFMWRFRRGKWDAIDIFAAPRSASALESIDIAPEELPL
jgi:multidrug resistance protein, MATE family